MRTQIGEPAVVRRQDLKSMTEQSGLDLTRLGTIVLEKTKLMRETLSTVLRGLGIRDVRAAHSADEAFRLFLDRPADLIFTDWCPGLNGLAFLEEVRHNTRSPNPCVPVVIVSANTELRHIYKAINSGTNEYLAKPFSATGVYKHIHTIATKDRPFVRLGSFFGPDRRRRRAGFNGDERRVHLAAVSF